MTTAAMLSSKAPWASMSFMLCITVVGGQNKICALKGSTVHLPCSAQHASTSLTWYTLYTNNLEELSIDENNVHYNITEGSNFTLTINDVGESDAKPYCCIETTDNPELCRQNQTELHVTELQVKVIPSTEGQTVTLMCSSSCPLTENPAAYIWYKNRQFLYEDWSPWYQELLSGEKAETYSCAVKGYEDLRAPEVSLNSVNETCFSVTYTKRKMRSSKLKSKDHSYSITYPKAVHVQMTPVWNSFIATCNTSCSMANDTVYQWYWNREKFSDCKSQDITVVQPTVDTLSCAIKSNEDVHSDEICTGDARCLSVKYVRRRICALEGSSVNISSQYTPNYDFLPKLWYKVNIGGENKDCKEVLSEDQGHVEYHNKATNSHTLRINDLKRNDSAEYTFQNDGKPCHLPGVMLVVTGLKVVMTPSAEVTEGQRVKLTCSTSCPLTGTNFIWYLNGHPPNLRHNQNKHLFLDPVNMEDAGNYSCAVETPQNISSSAEGLTVRAREKSTLILNALKIAYLLLMPSAAFLLYLRARKKKTVTATAKQSDRKQREQMEPSHESVALKAKKPDRLRKPKEQQEATV